MERWYRGWNLISYLVLLATTLIAVLDSSLTWQFRLLTCLLALLWGIWYWIFLVRFYRWGRSSRVLALSFVGAMALTLGLTFLHPIYLVLLFSFYGLTFSTLVFSWAVPAVILLSSAIIYRFVTLSDMPLSEIWGLVLGLAFATIFSILLGLYIGSIIIQSRERQAMIEELKATRSELAAAERQAGILAERQRLAREIHDTLAQGFTSIVMHLEAAEQALPPGEQLATPRRHLDQARRTARESLAEARRFVWALRTNPEERESLVDTVSRVVSSWSQESEIRASFAVSGVARGLPSPYEVTLLRTTQEALANIRKHANASQVDVTLTFMEDQVILDVQDNGRGFQADRNGETGPDLGGFGLIGLRERAAQMGGKFNP